MGDCRPFAQLAADRGMRVVVWCRNAPLELITTPGITTTPRWNAAIADSEVVLLDHPEMSRHFLRLASRYLPVIGGGKGLQRFPVMQGDVYYRLAIPTLPIPRGRVRTSWGLFSDRWLLRGGHRGGFSLLDKLSPYLSFIHYRGPWAVRWSRLNFSKFILDSSSILGYDAWVKSRVEAPVDAAPLEMQLKELVAGWH